MADINEKQLQQQQIQSVILRIGFKRNKQKEEEMNNKIKRKGDQHGIWITRSCSIVQNDFGLQKKYWGGGGGKKGEGRVITNKNKIIMCLPNMVYT